MKEMVKDQSASEQERSWSLATFKEGTSVDDSNIPEFLPRPWVSVVLLVVLVAALAILLTVKVDQHASGKVTGADPSSEMIDAELTANFRLVYGDELTVDGHGQWEVDQVEALGEGIYSVTLRRLDDPPGESESVLAVSEEIVARTAQVNLMSALVRGIGG